MSDEPPKTIERMLIVLARDSGDRTLSGLGYKIFGALKDGWAVEVAFPPDDIQGNEASFMILDEAAKYD